MIDLKYYSKNLRSKYLGHNIITYEEVESTNNTASGKSFPPNTVVVADQQKHGKGRCGRKWFSPPDGNLYFSIILDHEKYNNLLEINYITCFALCESLNLFLNCKIKWPNDILANYKKIAGILIDTKFSGSKIDKIIIGVGINIGSKGFPPEISSHATSIYLETGQIIEKEDILLEFLPRCEHFLTLNKEKKIHLSKIWEKYSAYFGKQILIRNKNSYETFIEKGLSDNGDFIVETCSGEFKNLTIGEIAYDTCT